jgi:hypothetical protein
MFFLLCLLLTVILGYWYLTDSSRVREMAQSYLSEVLNAPVEVGGATLSIFQGLRLDDVKVRVDHSARPDSVIFSAQTFLIRYDLRDMLRGKLAATQIVAINPHVYLSENLDTGRRNYQQIVRENRPSSKPSAPGVKPPVLPEILLRDARIEYGEVSAGHYRSLGSLQIEGSLSPTDVLNQYAFKLQSRGESEGIGPSVEGTLTMGTGAVRAKLGNFEFSKDIRTMLPAEVRRWWEEHQLTGRVDIPVLTFDPGRNHEPARFKVETALRGVSLSISPREWMGRSERHRRQELADTATLMRRVGLNLHGDVDRAQALLATAPIRLDNVTGAFIFTEDGIDIPDLTGRIETNGLKISGHIDGYAPDAAARLRLSSLETENLYIPRAPRYVQALPQEIREIYEHLHPEGTASMWVELDRPANGARPQVRGAVKILDGQFVFDLFPYPLRKATGRITFGPDPITHEDRCDVVNLRGLGVAGGPNQDTAVTINATIAPLADNTEVRVRVQADHVTSEPALHRAFPHEVQDVLKMFDPAGTGKYPTFSGGFVCNVIRPRGHDTKWRFAVDLDLDDANGAFELFPYPLQHAHGRLHITDDFVDIQDFAMQRKGGTLAVNGRVSFFKGQPLTPDLTITARHVPLDADFIAAIPPERRQWVESAGLSGLLDIDGRITRPPGAADAAAPQAHAPDITYDLQLHLRDGGIWPVGNTYAVSGVDAELRLTPQQLTLTRLSGHRDRATLQAQGTISDLNRRPHLQLTASAKDLILEPSLYQLLPRGAKSAWDQAQPHGTLDVDFTCDLPLGSAKQSKPDQATPVASIDPDAALAATRPAPRHEGFELTLRPRHLSVTPHSVPYRLDDLTGAIVIRPDVVLLQDMTARHGAATIALSGTGATGARTAWNLHLAADQAPVDDEFRRALPESLRSLADALKLQGTISFNFSKLLYRLDEPPAHAGAASPATRAASDPDVDFAGHVTLHDSALEAGVSLAGVNGGVDLSGTIRDGKLAELAGRLDFPSLMLADRPLKNLRADLVKPTDQEVMQLARIQAGIAGGELAGQVDLTFPRTGPSQYAVSIALRNANVRELAPQSDHDIRGLLNASLALEGNWSDPASRRGRGDVAASGKEMYRIPVLLGLLQITNLSLPISSPFNEASARYSVEGNRVTFEQIELRNDSMMMQGTGHLDFDTRKVKLSFVTDNLNGLKVPFVTDLFNGMKQELLHIHVDGSIESPKSAGKSANTLQTTVDQVYKGTERRRKK